MSLNAYYIPDTIILSRFCTRYNKQSTAIKVIKTKSKDSLLIAQYIPISKGNYVYKYLIFANIKKFVECLNLLKENQKRFYMVYS